MTDLRIICRADDGHVTEVIPTDSCLYILAEGGGISCAFHSDRLDISRLGLLEWAKHVVPTFVCGMQATGYMPLWLAREWEIEKFMRDLSWRADLPQDKRRGLAERWIDALIHGGLSEREGVELIAEKDHPLFSSYEIFLASDLPDDAYFDAWRRSVNGGPVWIDDAAAVEIDEKRMWLRYEGH